MKETNYVQQIPCCPKCNSVKKWKIKGKVVKFPVCSNITCECHVQLAEDRKLKLTRALKNESKIQQGWECPKCGSVYAPWVEKCTRCSFRETIPNGQYVACCGGVCPRCGQGLLPSVSHYCGPIYNSNDYIK